MKKLLLLSLLAMGATSFAAIEGTPSKVEMPIKMRGVLVASTSANLMIEAETTGMAGNIMDFDFGDLQIPGAGAGPLESAVLTGSYRIWKPTGNLVTYDTDAAKTAAKLKVGLNEAGDSTRKETIAMGTGLEGNLELTKALTINGENHITEVNGKVLAKATVKVGASAGSFNHTAEKIYVKIDA